MDLSLTLSHRPSGGNSKWNPEECEDCKGKGHVEGEGSEAGNGRLCSKRSRGPAGKQQVPGQKNKALENLEDCMKSLMISQIKETFVYVEESFMALLRKCLASRIGSSRIVVIRGNTDYYESKKDVDVGWGCGWRNIQILASYLLAEDPEVREHLFGGTGYVPDIPALQQWLEIAWAKGFDAPGGEYFDWKIKGSNKWIGTTEGAALLRSFGVRARIVDFQAIGSKRESPSELRSKAGQGSVEEDKSGSGSEEEAKGKKESNFGSRKFEENGKDSDPQRSIAKSDSHDKCIDCGEHETLPNKFRPEKASNSDMCHTCTKLQGSGNMDKKKFHDEQETQITNRHRLGWDAKTGGGGAEEGQITVKHQPMVEWVWNYFMSHTRNSKVSKQLKLSERSPLYFQHRGHSQTIVGVECRKVSSSPDSEEVNLLVVDPSESAEQVIESLREGKGWEKYVKRGLQTLKQKEYQLCYVERGIAKGSELDNLKFLTSKSYTY
ncbi:uncharacterized protein [Physcomitrium patens]|uniref:UFSP1/2/DUB catalytic domain-containing protein n=1 Tax=Physcomitrium patens TaxID=3218 RepID=A0A2K1IDH7_PHYPA|nr:uncharacterized protein LOC112277540 [Physcomitrium patens]XP_024365765.1 uncharacterized protein LOC112277540 [Physcomitrium patens]XP_024365766.1 uncharacterized protein LOC112277540 [Physcomitrium patens]XP_024365767.1 uncharacterized protein LOC112277540 [Physcomitrium patens]XP_024365768.1 uncharacterized protein LOC112277540 [Physcomitrium patens]XP_024365769.1 uncharacterized protein LOC112277540 [Physcomitrium patens]XP_024365770.1 uncharacterized protein LOC112277540 [Physcomitriu|eukprot:XP_024365764.1 uncharacterized protein LOC112277540 [Physcomitrella patens]